MLDANTLTDEKGKSNKRAGFDPFEGMPTYSETKYKKAKRTLPDLTTRPYGQILMEADSQYKLTSSYSPKILSSRTMVDNRP